MTTTTSATPQAFLREHIGDLVVQPVQKASVAIQAATVVQAAPGTSAFRVPIVTDDPKAAWTAEGAPITTSDQGLDEAVCPFYKVAGLVLVSNELASDQSPEAAELIGQGLARDIARQIDAAFFGMRSTADGAHVQPPGLGNLEPGDLSEIDAGPGWANVDPFTEAVYAAEVDGATVGAFVAHPTDALDLARLKEETGSNRPLLQPDPTQPSRRLVQGVPLLTSDAVEPNAVWGIPAGGRVIVAIRQDATLEVDRSVAFKSDQTAIRAVMRLAFVYPHKAAIQRVAVQASDDPES